MIIKYLILGFTIIYVVTVIINYTKPDRSGWRLMEILINTLLVIGIFVAIFALYGCLMLLFVWYVEHFDDTDYYPDISHWGVRKWKQIP